jgi:mono/diheme cytochrome c family protein
MLRGCGPALTKAHRREGSSQWNTLRTVCAGRILMVAVSAVMIFGTTRVRARTAAQASKPAAEPTANAQNGRKLFVKYGCYECHGYEAQGSIATGPRLGPDPLPLDAFKAYVRKPAGEMPPYTDKVVSDQDLADIHAFLESLPQPKPAKDIPLLNY